MLQISLVAIVLGSAFLLWRTQIAAVANATGRVGAAIAKGVGHFLTTQWRQFNPLGQLLFVLAILAGINDACISFKYGWEMTFFHAVGFALVAVGLLFLPDAGMTEFRKGHWGKGLTLWAVCAPLVVVAMQSHLGYGSGVRSGDMQQTGFHNAKVEAAQNELTSERTNLAMWRSRLAELKGSEKAMREANPWAAKTTADALTADIRNQEGDHVFKRSKGCNNVTLPESRVFCDRLAGLRSQLGKIGELNKIADEIEKLQGQIAATQRLVDGKSTALARMNYHSSAIVNQNDVISKLVNIIAMGATDDALKLTLVQREITNTAVAGSASLAFLLLAPTCMLAAGFNRVLGAFIPPPSGGTSVPAPEVTAEAAPASVGPSTAPTALPALAALQARRTAITNKIAGMRQSRIDGGLLNA